MDVREQRVQFVVAATRKEKSLTALCKEFGISRPTGWRWRKRYQGEGIGGIAERSRRPRNSPRLTSPELEERVVEERQRYPDWGARKLQVMLQRQGVELTRSTIHRILLRRGLVREWDQHAHAVQRFERSQPNELWQMDFKSPRGWSAPIGPLSVIDDHSRYVLVLHHTGSTRAKLVREQLQKAFLEVGVPQAMLMDHGIPWWSEQAPTGATELTIWLMKQGIQLHWSGIRHPQTQGKVERFHGELERALRRRGWVECRDSSGWTSSDGNTIMFVRTKHWDCGHRPQPGMGANGSSTLIRRHGNTKLVRWCASWTAMASSRWEAISGTSAGLCAANGYSSYGSNIGCRCITAAP
jgi:transposase InsO family protein